MQPLQPTTPKNLNPLARELLESFAGHAEAAEIVLGGGVALSHYLEYRDTVDVDAWWRQERSADVVRFAEQCMMEMAARHGLNFRRRTWGETESLELLRGSQKQCGVYFYRSKIGPIILDHSVYTNRGYAQCDLNPEERADYVRHVCSVFDCGIFPEETDWQTFAGWKDVFDRFPIADSPAYHTFRHWYRWEPTTRGTCRIMPDWKAADLREGRTDPCEEMV